LNSIDRLVAAQLKLDAKLVRLQKEKSYATDSKYYGRGGDPANFVKFEREKGEYMDRIKELLAEWASHQIDKRHGYPSKSAFANERVDGDNRSTDTYREMPAEIVKLDVEIEKLAPGFKRVVALEYLDRRPQKTKAVLLGIPRQVFSQRLGFVHEQLTHAMWG
jgi:hypothetical protein